MKSIYKLYSATKFSILLSCSIIFSLKEGSSANSTPIIKSSIINSIKQDAASRLQIPISDLQISSSSYESFNDSCLELPKPKEICRIGKIKGWQVTVEDNVQKYTYHVTAGGKNLRLKPTLPVSIANKIKQLTAQELKLPAKNIRISETIEYTYQNTCLDITEGCQSNKKATVDGWKVIAHNFDEGKLSHQKMIYHLDKSGKQIVANREAAKVTDYITINFNKPDNKIENNVVFASRSLSFFSGISSSYTLTNDGKLTEEISDTLAQPLERKTKRKLLKIVTPQKMKVFKDLLLQQKLAKFNSLSYYNFISVDGGPIKFISADGSFSLFNVDGDTLPKALSTVSQAWYNLVSE
jgi:hypothetical protein